MNVMPLLLRLRAQGFALEPDGESLAVTPGSKLTPDDLSELRQAKPAIMRTLVHEVHDLRRCLRMACRGISTRPLVELLERLFPGIAAVQVTSFCEETVHEWPLRDDDGKPNGWWPLDTGLILPDGREVSL